MATGSTNFDNRWTIVGHSSPFMAGLSRRKELQKSCVRSCDSRPRGRGRGAEKFFRSSCDFAPKFSCVRGHKISNFWQKQLRFLFSPRENLTFNFKLWYNLKKRQNFFIKNLILKIKFSGRRGQKKEGRTFCSPRSFRFWKLTLSG